MNDDALYNHHANRPGTRLLPAGGMIAFPSHETLPDLVLFSSVLFRIGLVVACLAGPIIWGVVVNWLFTSWQKRGKHQSAEDDEPVFPDYQI